MKLPSLLTEQLSPSTASLCEMRKGQDLYLKGVFMQAECVNGNGRKYRAAEMERVVQEAQKRITEGFSICGELNHPDSLSIDLGRVSHVISSLSMDGNNVVGKMKLLNTPCGNIAKGLIEGGVRLGVSSRGTGNVNESGEVSDFSFVTVDIVSQPSAPDAYPSPVMEAMNNKKIMSLAEALVGDPRAQSYLRKEISVFLQSLTKGK